DAHYLAATAVGCDGPRDVDSVCSAAPFYPKVDRWVVSLLATPGWSWGCVSAMMSADERSGLRTHIATMESVSLFVPRKNLSIAKACQRRDSPRHGAMALRLRTGYSA